MSIESVELMHECCPENLTADKNIKNEIRQETEEGKQKRVNLDSSKECEKKMVPATQ